MTTFGQDQVVVSPLKDLYDTNIMQMAIAAAKDMYDKNYADMKEFAKTYGDFVSPIGNYTQQYYDMSKGLVNKKIDELYARGIDPLRSAQGRAEIQKIINSVDVGRLNQMKAETEAAKQYMKNRAELQAKGLYNPEFEKYMLGGQTIETWDGSQPWTATSPYIYQDYNSKYGHMFDKMALSYDPEMSAKYPGYIVKTKSKKTMNQILNASIPEMMRDPQYQYDLNQMMARNPNMSQEDAIKAINEEIINRNWENSAMDIQQDPYYAMQMEYKYKSAENAQKHRYDLDKIRYAAQFKDGGGTDGNGATVSPPGFYQRQNENSSEDTRRVASSNLNIESYKAIRDYWINRAKTDKGTGAKANAKFWSNVVKNPGNYKNKLMDDNGVASPLFQRNYLLATMPKGGDVDWNNEAQYYSIGQHKLQKEDAERAIDLISAGSPEAIGNEKSEDTTKYTPIQFGVGKGVHLTRVREVESTGRKLGGMTQRFDEYLNNNDIRSWVPDKSDVRMKSYGANKPLDTTTKVTIRMSVVDDFISKDPAFTTGRYRGKSLDEKRAIACKKLGLVSSKRIKEKYKDSKKGPKASNREDWVEFSITHTNNISGYDSQVLDTPMDKDLYGSTKAGDLSVNRAAYGATFMTPYYKERQKSN